MGSRVVPWLPAGLLGLGCLLLLRVGEQQALALRVPLDSLPSAIAGYRAVDLRMPAEEERVAGVSNYLLRVFERDSTPPFSLYVGYYDSQGQGRTIHSPKNCLPGAGWEPLSAGVTNVPLLDGDTRSVNRYIIGRDGQRALVLYWYQGRGRVEASEYAVKWQLLRDKARHGRSDEALVRIVVPIAGRMEAADSLALSVAGRMIPAIHEVLPSS